MNNALLNSKILIVSGATIWVIFQNPVTYYNDYVMGFWKGVFHTHAIYRSYLCTEKSYLFWSVESKLTWRSYLSWMLSYSQ